MVHAERLIKSQITLTDVIFLIDTLLINAMDVFKGRTHVF